eukprot:gene38118-46314_t
MNDDSEFSEKRSGASRAVLKKRKKLEKSKNKANAQSTGTTGLKQESHNSSGSRPKKVKKHDNLFSRPDLLAGCSFDCSTLTLGSILSLLDPDEATCYVKAALAISKFTYPVTYAQFYSNNWETTPLLVEHAGVEYFGGDCLPTKKAIRTLIKSHVWNVDTLRICNQHNEIVYINESIQGPSAAGSVDVDSDCFIVQLDGGATFTTTAGDTASRQYKLQPGHVLYLPATEKISFSPIYAQDAKDQKPSSKNSAATSPAGTMFMLLTITKLHTRIADLLHLSLSQAVYMPGDADGDTTSTSNVLLKSLPAHIHSALGVSAHNDDVDDDVVENDGSEQPLSSKANLEQRIMREVEKAMQGVVKKALSIVHPAADQLKKSFIAERLPPYLSPQEEQHTAANAPDIRIMPYTALRVARPGIAVTVVEDGKVVVYHAMDNSRELFGSPLNPLEFELDDGPCLEALLTSYPHAIQVMHLPHPSEEVEDKVGVAEALYREGLLVVVDEISRAAGGDDDGGEEEGDEDGDSDDPF